MQLVLDQPFGRIWLGLIGLGLVGFVGWRLTQSALNTDHHPGNAKGYAARAALLVSAATYSGLAVFALGHALSIGNPGGSQDGSEKWSSWLMQQPFGRYLVGIVGLLVVAGGIAQLIRAASRGYRKYFDADWKDRRLLDGICMYGLAARGVILVIVGWFFVYASVSIDPGQAGSTADALLWVRQQPFGGMLYILIALGLLAFGGYGFIEARYRIINPPTVQKAKQAFAF